ncbi:choline transporter-like protein 1 isoform X2 [Nilaparvata lugens]|uniref:choline transporter-like protein 1 isoform X2 n=1 Tax=Nilaparvata lugens TaxID=108931 RepID=UPI00193E8B9E|nr:choline transporter-like protein 1 isoform X2 [Nilaparvata lugens]
MGGCLSSEDRVTPFGNSAVDGGGQSKADFKGPVRQRSCTDLFFLIFMGMFIIILAILLGYCISHGNIYRIINGFDSCGNVCGMVTKNENPAYPCQGKDMTDKKLISISAASGRPIVNPKYVHRDCVAKCDPDYIQILNRCVKNTTSEAISNVFSKTGLGSFFQEVSEDLHVCWKEMLYLCIISFILSLTLLFLLRFMAGFVVWFVMIGAVVTSIGGTIYLWLVYKQKNAEEKRGEITDRITRTYFYYAIIATIVTFMILLVIFVMRKRIQLVVQLFHEAGKAISRMPLLLFQPLATFFALFVMIAIFLYFSIWIESSGRINKYEDNLYYSKDTAMKITRWYNIFAMYWFTQFFIGCQHMIIAGSVATWFFTRDKSTLSSPISTSYSNMVNYHLGSIALGSFLIAVIQFIRTILKFVEKQVKGQTNEVSRCVFKACQCCLYIFEKCLAFLTRNAYIEIAIYGVNFCTGGQQAFKMLVTNVLRVAAINSVGDFILFLGKVFVVAITLLIGTFFIEKDGVQHMWVPLTLVGIFAYLVSHCFMTVYEMTIDTIFICFCEDCEMNDGISKPYFMSKGLMEFVEHSQKVLSVGDGQS